MSRHHNFSLAFLLLLHIGIFTPSYGASNVSELCGDASWSIYNNTGKCIKLFDSTVLTQEEAQEKCRQEVGASIEDPDNLLTITSEEEQTTISQYLFRDLQVVDNVWLGAKRKSGQEFQWGDGTPVTYANWEGGSPSEDPLLACVQLTSRFSRPEEDGLWKVTPCSKKNLVVCQKSQTWSPTELTESLNRLLKEFEQKSKQLEEVTQELQNLRSQTNEIQTDLSDAKTEIDSTKTAVASVESGLESTDKEIKGVKTNVQSLENNPVPIGFIYVQLPNQADPSVIWPSVTWLQVTSEYAGLFFRAEGGSSSAFESIQADSTRQITGVYGSWTYGSDYANSISVPSTGYSSYVWTGYMPPGGTASGNERMQFYTSNVEVRPRNTAIRIWRRSM